MPCGGNLARTERYLKAARMPRSAHARYYYTRSLVLEPKRKEPRVRSRCLSASKAMDSHSRSASPRDPPRPQHRPPSPPPTAFDNQAYLPDEPADPNHNDSFVSSTVNGHTKEPNGDTKALEAVNLELVNLQPKNGNGKKKDVEVDMNGQNPYDEYFVPVNEHRKYMRGEKLYVTADKRGEKGGCKRPLCWTILGLIVAAVVVLIVLAATGVLFTNSPTPVEQYNSSVSSARAFGGIHVHDHGHDHDHDHDHDHHDHSQDHSSEEPQPEPQPEPNAEPEPAVEPSPVASSEHGSLQNDQQDRSTSLEAGDASLYVPRTVEGQLRVDNEDFKPGMLDADSEEYRQFSANFVSALKEALVDRGVLGSSDDDDVTIEVVDLKQGSVIVTYRIHWKPKTENAKEDLITAETLQMNLDKYLARNNRMISVYHIADDKLITRPLLDLCQANKNNCEYGCEFDETTLEFTCTCPTGQVLDMNNMKKCIQFFESENHEETVHDTKSKEVQSDHNPSNENVYDWKDVHPTIMETTTESEGDVHFSHIFGHSNVPLPEPEPTAEPKPEPEPSAEPKPEPEPTAEPKPEPEPTSEPKPEPTAEPKPEPAPTSEPEPEPQATVIPLAEPAPESASEPTSVTVPEPVAEPKPSSEPEPSSEPKPTAEPEPESVEPEYHLKPKEVVKNVELEPTAEPEPTSEPEPIIHKASVDSAPSAEPEIKSEEEADHKTDKHTHVSDPKIAINDAFYDFKYNDEDEIMSETTTTRVLVPELKEINGPFHNMPEITSMLSNIDHHINETTPISHENESQSRSFKSSVDEIMAEIYPTEIYTNKDVSSADTSDTIVKSEEESNTENEPSTSTFFPISLQKNNPSEEVSITTTAKTTASLSINKMGSDLETIMMNTEITTAEPETIYTTSQQELQVNNEETKDVMLKRIEQTHVLNSEASVQTITTEEPLEVTDVSLTHFIQDKNENQLLEVLGKKEPEKAETTTESDPSLEGMEVTFDAINMLYNRSSKVVQNKTNIKDEETTDINVSAITTDASDSDWLSEPVREINFEDSGTNTEKLAPQTESSVAITKIDEIMNKGVTKDDFEPDYLNNMSPSNKNSERDEPFYGMAHDYDSEDPRVKKRVSPKNADFTTEAFTTTIVPLKTTTISEFIYQKAESTETAEPKLTENVTEPIIQFVAKENTSDILEASTESSVEKAVTTISSQNGTQLNNLNVTIYEVPSNNDNQTNSVTKPIANTLSSEYEDHETEMNPFLPEIENNKSLVKKLQEGHDLEPVNVNETQNENIEEHTKSTKESQEIVKNSTSISVLGLNHDNSVSTTTEDVFHELIMAGNSESLEHNHEDTTSDIISSLQNTEKPEEELQTISKFLQDTDDLISSKEYTTLEPSTELEIHSEMELKSDTTSSNPEKTTIISKTSGDDDDEYLSVVPITSEKEEKDFLKKNSNSDDTYQELNDISDSRKKSDRRTFDIANPNSVINNEA